MSRPTARLRAASISPKAHDWLRQTQQAHILYVFEKAINLLNQEGDVLSIVSGEIGNGPFALKLQEGEFPQGVAENDQVLVFENSLWLGDWLIDAEEAETWDPVPKWGSINLDTPNSQKLASLLTSVLRQYAPGDSFARLIVDPLSGSSLPARIFQTAEQNIPLLAEGITSTDENLLRTASKRLAGLGPGLTPAGDDLLMGVIHGLFGSRPFEIALGLSSVIARAAGPRTHLLSEAWLRAAARGEADSSWHGLVASLAQENWEAVQAAMRRILDTGHTSGADALGGFLLVLQSTV